MRKIIGLLACVTIVLFSCKEASKKGEWKKLTTKNNLVSFQYPDNWRLDTSGKMGADLYLFSDKTENINLLIQDVENYDIDTYTKLSEGQIRSIEGSVLYESKRTELNGDVAHFLDYEANLSGQRNLRYLQYYVIKNKKAFIITFTSELDRFEDSKELGVKIMKTFKIK